MLRFLTLALLASAALPVAANAQRGDNDRPRFERGPRADRPERTEGPRFQRQPRAEAPAAPAAVAQPQARPDRGAWRARSDDGQSGWRNRGGDGQRAWRADRNPVVAPQPQPQPRAEPIRGRNLGIAGTLVQARQRDQQRDWNRNGDQRRDWNRNDAQRRDWNRNDAQRRDWNRDDNRRWDSNRNWNDNRGWNGNRGSWNNNRSWNRTWRNDRRYDWQGYRSLNRQAYRLPRYYAPSGWQYGYRRFDIGATLFSGLFAQNYWINDPFNYRLPPVEWPFQWVRYYDDALLVDTETGEVVDSIPGIFW